MHLKNVFPIVALAASLPAMAQVPMRDVTKSPKFWKSMEAIVTFSDVSNAATSALKSAGGTAATAARAPFDVAWNGEGFLVRTASPTRCFVPVDNRGTSAKPSWQAGGVTCL